MSTNDGVTRQTEEQAPDVFISYARADRKMVLRLASALETAEWHVWVDTEDIPPTADWNEELAVGIRTAHTFVFVVSPRSVRSEYCLHELDQAVELGKRLVPVVIEDADDVPEMLAARQYIDLREDDDFEASLATLTTALATDLDWVREHRQWLNAALRWDASGRDRSLLIRGRDLKSAEAWLASQAERTEPRPTGLQTEFLIASRSWETRRLQAVIMGVAVALAVAILLGVLALLQRNTARRAAATARSRERAIAATSVQAVDPELSLLLAIQAVKARSTAEADNSLRAAVNTSRVRREIRVRGEGARSLISDVTSSPSSGTVAVALQDGGVRLVRLGPGRGGRVASLPDARLSAANQCSQFVRAQGDARLAFSDDGRWVAAAGDRSVIELWRLPHPRSGTISNFCLGDAAVPSPSKIALASLSPSAAFGTVALAFARGPTLVAVERDGRLLRWRWTAGVRPTAERISAGPVRAAAFVGRGARRFVFVDRSGVHEWPSGRRLLALPRGDADRVVADADGGSAAVAGGRSITIWTRGAAAPTTVAAGDLVRSLAISRAGRFVASGDNGGVVRVWTVGHPGSPVILRGSSGAVTAVAFDPSGRRVLSAGDDGVLRVWDWDPSTTIAPLADGGRVSLSRDGRLVTSTANGVDRAWIALGGQTHSLDDVADPAALAFDRNGRHAVAATAGARVLQLWDLSARSRPSAIPVDRHVWAASVSPDGSLIASGEDNRLRVLRWPGRTATVLEQPNIAAGKVAGYNALAFSPDGRRLASAAYNGKTSTVEVWDLQQLPLGGKQRRMLKLDAPGFVTKLAFSPDGRRLLAAMSEGPLRLWNLDDSSVVVLRGHHGTVEDAAFNRAGTAVISGGKDGTVRIWQLTENGKAVTIPARIGRIEGVTFTPDGQIEAVGSTGGARRWPCDSCGPIGDVLARAETLATRVLSPDERALYLHQH